MWAWIFLWGKVFNCNVSLLNRILFFSSQAGESGYHPWPCVSTGYSSLSSSQDFSSPGSSLTPMHGSALYQMYQGDSVNPTSSLCVWRSPHLYSILWILATLVSNTVSSVSPAWESAWLPWVLLLDLWPGDSLKEGLGQHRAYLVCLLSLKDYCPPLVDSALLKTVFYIFCWFFSCFWQEGKSSPHYSTPSWPEADMMVTKVLAASVSWWFVPQASVT